MKKYRGSLCAVLALTLVGAAPATHALGAFSYSFDQFDQANSPLAPGASVTVPVYLCESVNPGVTPQLISEHGLATASVLLMSSDTAVAITNVTVNPAFDGVVFTTNGFVDATTAGFPDPRLPGAVDEASLYASIFWPEDGSPSTTHIMPMETAPGSGQWRVLLGSFEFTARGKVGDSADFRAYTCMSGLSDFSTSDAFNGETGELLGNPDPVDPANPIDTAEVSFTVTSVPEPAALSLLGLGGVGFLVRRRR